MKKPLATLGVVISSIVAIVGIAGLFTPKLPGLPLILFAAIGLMHTSPDFVSRFNRTPRESSYIDDLLRERSMTRRNKIRTLSVTSLLLIVLFVITDSVVARILYAVFAVGKYWFFYFYIWTKVEDGHGCPDGVDCPDDKGNAGGDDEGE
ncbi:MAG TPA: DUF454 family protein [Spirochaetales bacterium]|nr:DUF454 family protein [Spirochaetales bacterium]HPG86534.1 DUF454 family protein [Spirochaetales bacterium]HPM71728.1 DUF454 family protein [Spirochaetales bacterium]